ncbi:MAG: phosphoglucosamine mutase, partial [Rubrobacteraceae bacterium]
MEEITFGTDGVRGVANGELTPEIVFDLGLAAARAFGGAVLIGHDTRLSGGMLSASLSAGLASGGADVVDLGVLPT